jgi:Flp pilus assembly protein TadG
MNAHLTSRVWRNRKGQELVELALMLPLLVMLTMGVVDLGRALGVYIGLKSAAREGARFVSLYANQTTVTEVQDRVIAEVSASGFPGLTRGDVTVVPTLGWSDGRPVTVRVSYSFSPLTTALFGGAAVPLHASAEMVVLGSP